MSVKVFILIEAEVSNSKKIVAALKEVEGVTMADHVTGPYEIIAVVKAERLDEIGSIIQGKIQSLPGVSRIVSCLAINEAVKKD